MSDKVPSPYEMAELYIGEAELNLAYIREDLEIARSRCPHYDLGLTAIHARSVEKNIEMLRYAIRLMRETAKNA